MLSGKLWFVPLPISIILSDLVKDVTSSRGSHNDLVELSGGYINIKVIFIHSNSKYIINYNNIMISRKYFSYPTIMWSRNCIKRHQEMIDHNGDRVGR